RVDGPEQQADGERNGQEAQINGDSKGLDLPHRHSGPNDEADDDDLAEKLVSPSQASVVVRQAKDADADAPDDEPPERQLTRRCQGLPARNQPDDAKGQGEG